MGQGMTGRRLFDFITDGGVDWSPMPDVYDVFVYPGLTVKVPKGRANFERALVEAFPAEKQAIGKYFRDIKRAADWFNRHIMAMVTPQPVSWIVQTINRFSEQSALQTTQQYLESHIRDPRLRAVLASQWADYGLPPGRSAFVAHAVIVSHYLNGAWYPVGGAGEIPKAASSVIRAAGGELLAGHEVTKIILEGGRAVGVEVQPKKGKEQPRLEFRAPVIVSDAGAWNTFTRLLPSEAIPFRAELETPPEGLEAVELFLGLKRDPRELGFQGENYWIFSSFDHDQMCAGRDDLLDGRAPMVYLSFPSLKDPQARSHTAEIIAPFSYRTLEAFREEPWRRRGTDYESAKAPHNPSSAGPRGAATPGLSGPRGLRRTRHASYLRIFHGSAVGDDLRISGDAGQISKELVHAQDPDPEPIPHRRGCSRARNHGRLDGRSCHGEHAARSRGFSGDYAGGELISISARARPQLVRTRW